MVNLTECIRGGSREMRAGFIIAFPYDEETIRLIKCIPFTEREWREESKKWWVSGLYEDVLKRLFSNFEALVYLQGRMF